ncbi:uncharacterized protein LOC131676179 [Topomyia yanbarensis]|uniref:uncharacterized protein LOC131676179 n=1 Tax=Topomyia yanbarensis TaxID=2498891 RepID=UPI00273A8F9C|nr:uncharacterized protein LOC131676179 [Topomyia yanbarensis]
MVQCDGCNEWYHFSCVEVSEGIADVSWICMNCEHAKDLTPSPLHTPNVSSTTSTVRSKSKASSIGSQAKRRQALELQWLEEEKELERRYLELKYKILLEGGSDCSSIVSEPQSVSMSKVKKWIDDTDGYGEKVDCGSEAEELEKRPPRNSTASIEHHAPVPDQQRATQVNIQLRRPPQRVSGQQETRPIFGSSHMRQSVALAPEAGSWVEANAFVPGQRSTPVGRPSLPAHGLSDDTACVLNRSQIAARQAVSKDLPDFSGNPEDWPLFFSMFNSSTQMCGFSNEENMLRLRKCLKGRALEAVRCRLLHPSNVAGVLSTLKMLYGRPEAIVQAVIKKIRSLPSPSIEKLETVVNFALTVENLVATIQACEVSDFVYNASLRYELVGRLPPTLKLSWARFSRNNPTPNLLDFSTWLYETAEDASAVVDTVFSDQRFRGTKRDGFLNVHSEIDSKDSKSANSPQKPTIVDTKKCVACKGDCTMLAKCKQFVDLSYDSKWATVRAYKLCRKCLRKHNGSCRQEKPCGTNGCTYLHHPLLHGYGNPRSGESPTAAAVYEKSCNVHQVQSEILFRVVPVILYGPSKAIRTYAFLDDGSELTLLEQSLADELGLRGPKNPLCLKWTGETTKIENRSQNVSLQISSVTNPIKRYDLSSVRTIRNLQIRPQTLLTSELQQRYQHLMGLPIESYNEANPRILIGLDNATLGYAMKSREGQSNEPIAIKTRLGWIVFGSCVGEKNAGHYVNYHALQICQCNRETSEDLHELVKGYFALDSLGISKQSKLLLSHEDQRAQSMLESLTRPVDSRFESGLLWKYDSVRLPDSAAMALRRWRCLDNRMKKDPLLAGELNAKIQDHINKGYIRKLSAEELEVNHPRVWYLPIFPIVNPNKPGKTRLVWDAAATAFGVSLNSVLLKGPDQLTSLLSVLIQFREFRTAVCGDIREMYHQVRMREDDQHCQRFF